MTFSLAREQLSHFFTIGMIISVLGLLVWLFSGFIGVFVGAMALGISFYPFYQWIGRRFPKCPASVRAAIADFVVVLVLVIPLCLMTWAAVEQSESWRPAINDWNRNIQQWRAGNVIESNDSIRSFSGWLNTNFSIRPSQFRKQLINLVESTLGSISALSAMAAGSLLTWLTSVAMMIFALFFVFRDGKRCYAIFEDYLPLREEQKAECRERGKLIITGVIRGWLIGAVVQGIIATLGYMLIGVKAWIVWGLLTMMAGLLPVFGTALVWCPLAVNAFLTGHPTQGALLFAWGGFVSVIDNVIRPYLVGKTAQIPFVGLFFALVGGIALWGFKGIILGPLLLSIAPVVFDIYRKRYIGSAAAHTAFTETRMDSGFFVADGLEGRALQHAPTDRKPRKNR